MTTREVEKPTRYPGIRQAKIVVRSAGTGKYFRVLVEEIRKGVPSKTFVETAKRMGLGQEELARKLGLKPRTIASRLASREKKLNPNESERVLRIKQIFDQAVQVFGSEEQAREWVMNTAYGLEGQRPIDLMDTEPGSSQVREYLGAIEQGNYW
jgi:putative toxin-antitoxin system antitoxin component (TIGR02293 family)